MTLYLLDSDGLIDHLKGIQSTTALIQSLPAQGHVLCSCDIVIAEIYAGLSRACLLQPVQRLSSF